MSEMSPNRYASQGLRIGMRWRLEPGGY